MGRGLCPQNSRPKCWCGYHWLSPLEQGLLTEAETFGQGAGAGGIWWVETRMLLDTLRGPDSLTTKNYLAPAAPRWTDPAMVEHLPSPPRPLLASRGF